MDKYCLFGILRKDTLRNAAAECIQLYNHLTVQKRLKQLERVANQVVTLGLHYSRNLTSEEILAMKDQLSVTMNTVVNIFSELIVKGQLYYFTSVEY